MEGVVEQHQIDHRCRGGKDSLLNLDMINYRFLPDLYMGPFL